MAAFRSQYSRTFAVPGGGYVARVYAQPVNYLNAQGQWAPINDSLVAAGAAVVTKADSDQVSIPDQLSAAPVSVSTRSGRVALALQGARGVGAVHGSTDVFAGALPGVTIRYAATGGTLKESLTLSSPRAQSRFAYRLRLSRGLVPRARRGGGIVVWRGRRAVFSLLAPFMFDVHRRAVGRVSMGLRRRSGAWWVVVAADRRWLAAAGRRFPVTIDPSVFDGPYPDCTLQQAAPTSSLCDQASDEIAGGSSPDHLLLWFNVGQALPADSEVLSARVQMYLSSWTASTTTPVGVYGLTRSYASGATWNTYDGSHAWTTPGGDYGSSSYDTVNVPMTAGWQAWYPTPLVRGWVDGSTPNYGLVMKEPSDNVANTLTFLGSADPSQNGPFLDITYEPRVGATRAATLEQTPLTDRMGLAVNVANGDLMIQAEDLHIAGTAGLDQSVERTYNNLLSDASWSGNGWRIRGGVDEHLQLLDDGSVVYHDGTGSEYPFDTNYAGGWTTPPGIDATLAHNGDGTYTLTFRDGHTETYNASGTIHALKDQNGNTISYSYSGTNGDDETITDTQGRQTSATFSASTGFITQMTDSTGRQIQYNYDSNGNLQSYVDAAGKLTTYTYDSSNDLTQITDPDGEITKFTYDAGRRVTSITRVYNNLGFRGCASRVGGG